MIVIRRRMNFNPFLTEDHSTLNMSGRTRIVKSTEIYRNLQMTTPFYPLTPESPGLPERAPSALDRDRLVKLIPDYLTAANQLRKLLSAPTHYFLFTIPNRAIIDVIDDLIRIYFQERHKLYVNSNHFFNQPLEMSDSNFDEQSRSFLDWFKSWPGTTFHENIKIQDLRGRGAGRGIGGSQVLLSHQSKCSPAVNAR